MAAENKGEKESPQAAKGKKQMRIGAAVLLALLCAVGVFFFTSKDGGVATHESVVGVLDLQKLAQVHPDYGKLRDLEQECAQLEAALALQELVLSDNQADEELFKESADQKSRLEAIERHAQLIDELNARAEEKRQALKPQFDEEKSQASKPYLNEILNLRLKIDSADVFGLTGAQVQEMLDRIDELQEERGKALAELEQEQDRRFRQMIEADNSGPLAELRALEESRRQEMQQEEFDRQLDIQERNNDQMEQALSPIHEKINRIRQQAALEAKRAQLAQLWEKIYNDLAGRAAKLAVMHKLDLILAAPEDNLRGSEYEDAGFAAWQPSLPTMLSVNALDLTDELLQDIERQPF